MKKQIRVLMKLFTDGRAQPYKIIPGDIATYRESVFLSALLLVSAFA